jgi:hypothetical protein
MSIRLHRFDELSKQLEELQAAMGELDGKLGSVQFDPGNDAEVQQAIRTAERMVDDRLACFSSNPLVQGIAEQTKQRFREQIVAKAVTARPLLGDQATRATDADTGGPSNVSANPKVFLSHAWEDKDRFVTQFSLRLRARGIDAWLDKWEMKPGDSLVDKIFEEGLKNAQAVIVVLSENSVKKPWVREELNAALVRRIEGHSKLIPIVLDACEIPECLHSTLQARIKDLSQYDREFDEIVMAILGQYDKPKLGPLPAHATTIVDAIPDLTAIDQTILTAACEIAIEKGFSTISGEEITAKMVALEVGSDQIDESLEILQREGAVDFDRVLSGDIPLFDITPIGFERYAKSRISGYDAICRDIALAVVERSEGYNTGLAQDLRQPVRIIDHVLQMFELHGLLKLSWSSGGAWFFNISPELKRRLR